jgi:hypothetical protein
VPFARPLLPALCTLATLAALTVGCGSDGSGSGYGAGDSTEQPPTATATTPEAPPGASARDCRVVVIGAVRTTGIGCESGGRVVLAWLGKPVCSAPAGASRFSCTVEGGYRCSGASTDRGIAVSCARPGASVAFVAPIVARRD